MKIYYNSRVAKIFTFLAGFKTIMLCGAIFTEEKELSERTKQHESTHIVQYQTLFCTGLTLAVVSLFILLAFDIRSWWMLSLIFVPVFLYYAWYLIEFFIRLIICRDMDKAYRMIAFEQEAYALENEYLKPCYKRKTAYSFSFLKYYINSI